MGRRALGVGNVRQAEIVYDPNREPLFFPAPRFFAAFMLSTRFG